LATSKVYVDNVLRSMADSLLVIDANLTIGSTNPSLLDLLGYEEDELIGQSPGLIFGEEFAQGSIIENLLLQGSVSGIESSFLTRDGRLIPISVSGSMMQDEQGQFQGLVCVAQDITERKVMEEEKLQLHEQLLETSRRLGMAEVASDVLHNVGNVLNSINVSIGVVADLFKNSMVGDVARISQLFHQHREDLGSYFSTNPKGKQIPAYLEKLSGQLVEEQRVAISELDRLRENAQHAQHCVASQQDLAKVQGITEPISVVELMDEALAVNHELLETQEIVVSREFDEIPQLIVDKHQVLEVLVDVIRNGCQAMAQVSPKQLIVRAKLIPGPPDSVCLEIQDSGVGIPTDDLTKIFGQGYNTRDGGRGMSLHNGALVAKNLGGALRAHSEGFGHGATFALELPGNFQFPDL
jgi:PAS domain S-box-containing protein